MKPIIDLEGLKQVLHDPDSGDTYTVYVESLKIPAGSFTAILGPSGCGKTTLLSVLGLLRARTKGSTCSRFQMWFAGEQTQTDVTPIWQKNLRTPANSIRRRHIGFALQSGELLPALTVAENVEAPLRINGVSGSSCQMRVQELIEAFDLYRRQESSRKGRKGSLRRTRVNRLSGGEYQRVGLARAIAHKPSLIFVDEPTANLNREMANKALQQLRDLSQSETEQSTVLMITHDEALAVQFCDYIIEMVPHPSISSAGKVHSFQTIEDFVSSRQPTQTVMATNNDCD